MKTAFVQALIVAAVTANQNQFLNGGWNSFMDTSADDTANTADQDATPVVKSSATSAQNSTPVDSSSSDSDQNATSSDSSAFSFNMPFSFGTNAKIEEQAETPVDTSSSDSDQNATSGSSSVTPSDNTADQAATPEATVAPVAQDTPMAKTASMAGTAVEADYATPAITPKLDDPFTTVFIDVVDQADPAEWKNNMIELTDTMLQTWGEGTSEKMYDEFMTWYVNEGHAALPPVCEQGKKCRRARKNAYIKLMKKKWQESIVNIHRTIVTATTRTSTILNAAYIDAVKCPDGCGNVRKDRSCECDENELCEGCLGEDCGWRCDSDATDAQQDCVQVCLGDDCSRAMMPGETKATCSRPIDPTTCDEATTLAVHNYITNAQDRVKTEMEKIEQQIQIMLNTEAHILETCPNYLKPMDEYPFRYNEISLGRTVNWNYINSFQTSEEKVTYPGEDEPDLSHNIVNTAGMSAGAAIPAGAAMSAGIAPS